MRLVCKSRASELYRKTNGESRGTLLKVASRAIVRLHGENPSMNWLTKVAAYKVISVVPGGISIYNYSRKNITRSTVPARERVAHRVNMGMEYLKTLEKIGAAGRLKAGAHLDFGCGYNPIIPLLYYSLGCERQFLFDAIPCLDESLLDATIAAFLEVVSDPAWPHAKKIRRLPKREPGRPLAEHMEDMGMTYVAPCAGRFAEIKAVIDVVTCTGVLYYPGFPRFASQITVMQIC